MMNIVLQTDGGSRGNPGPSAAGVLIKTSDREYVFGFYLGTMTNNQAEYLALIQGLKVIKKIFSKQTIKELEVRLDSELLVKQLNGQYQIKDPTLRQYADQVRKLVLTLPIGDSAVPMVQFKHIYREENQLSDFAVNQVLDIQDGISKPAQTTQKS